MKNNSNFSHIRTYVRVLHRDDDYLDHAVMQVSLYIVSSPLSMQKKMLTKQGQQFSPFEVAWCKIEAKMFGALTHMATMFWRLCHLKYT